MRDITATSYSAGPFLLVGDAATLARPHTASGAAKALLDAKSLEHALRAGADRADVLTTYDAQRRAAATNSSQSDGVSDGRWSNEYSAGPR